MSLTTTETQRNEYINRNELSPFAAPPSKTNGVILQVEGVFLRISMYSPLLLSPGDLVVFLENLAEATVVHDGEVLQQEQVFVQLDAGRHYKSPVGIALHSDVGQQKLSPTFVHPGLSDNELCRSL